MDHAALKVLLQRRLQDTVADQYSSSIVDSFLAAGLSQFQSLVLGLNPDGFGPLTATFSTAVGTDSYSRVVAFKIFRMEIQDTSIASGWQKIEPENFQVLLDDEGAFTLDGLRYAEVGTKLFLRPTPDSVRTVRYWYTADLGSQLGWDAYDDLIPVGLHTLPVDLALMDALGENAESIEKVQARIAFKVALLETHYGRSTNQVSTPHFQPFGSQRSS